MLKGSDTLAPKCLKDLPLNKRFYMAVIRTYWSFLLWLEGACQNWRSTLQSCSLLGSSFVQFSYGFGLFLPSKVPVLTEGAFVTTVSLSSVFQSLALQSAPWLNLPGCSNTAQASWALSQWYWSSSLCWWFWTGKSNWRVISPSLYTIVAQ